MGGRSATRPQRPAWQRPCASACPDPLTAQFERHCALWWPPPAATAASGQPWIGGTIAFAPLHHVISNGRASDGSATREPLASAGLTLGTLNAPSSTGCQRKRITVYTRCLVVVGGPAALLSSCCFYAGIGGSFGSQPDGRLVGIDDAGPQIDLRAPRAVTGRYVLIWLTGIPPKENTDRFQGGIASASVFGSTESEPQN